MSDRIDSFDQQTNNRAEIIAAIKEIEIALEQKCNRLTIKSDSKYLISGITSWINDWKKKEWMTSAGKPVLNKDLWSQIEELNEKCDPRAGS